VDFEHVTFDLPHGTFHALQGGDPDGQPTLVLHGFPDHPPTATPFLAEQRFCFDLRSCDGPRHDAIDGRDIYDRDVDVVQLRVQLGQRPLWPVPARKQTVR
jgi:hypothetical protein